MAEEVQPDLWENDSAARLGDLPKVSEMKWGSSSALVAARPGVQPWSRTLGFEAGAWVVGGPRKATRIAEVGHH